MAAWRSKARSHFLGRTGYPAGRMSRAHQLATPRPVASSPGLFLGSGSVPTEGLWTLCRAFPKGSAVPPGIVHPVCPSRVGGPDGARGSGCGFCFGSLGGVALFILYMGKGTPSQPPCLEAGQNACSAETLQRLKLRLLYYRACSPLPLRSFEN